jgi:hypothetical protein
MEVVTCASGLLEKPWWYVGIPLMVASSVDVRWPCADFGHLLLPGYLVGVSSPRSPSKACEYLQARGMFALMSMSLTWNKIRASERRIESPLPLGPLGVHILYTASASHLPNTFLLIFGDPTFFLIIQGSTMSICTTCHSHFLISTSSQHMFASQSHRSGRQQSRSVGNNAAALGQAVSAYL